MLTKYRQDGDLTMEIPIGKYVITSDTLCYMLSEKKKVKEGENKGKEYLDTIGYYNTIEACLEDLTQMKIKESDAKTLHGLIEDIGEISKFIRGQFRKARGKRNDTGKTTTKEAT